MERLFVEFGIRASLIVLATALVLRVLRIGIAATQHSVWVGVLAVRLLLPVWIAYGPRASVPVLPASSDQTVVFDESPVTPIAMEIPSTPSVTRPQVWNWSAIFLDAYLLGAATLLLRLAIGTIRANRLTGASCAAPVTVGFLRPRIVLPACSAEWSQVQMDAVLTHERAHVRRRDPLFQWLALFNRAVFWFHPLAWWLERKISALAEEACDAAVLERGHDPRDYSRYLLELARAVQRSGTRVNVVAMAMPGSYLPQRVKNIIDGVRAPKISRTRLACAALGCAIPAAVFAAGTLDHAPQILPLPLPARTLPQPPVLLAQAPAPSRAPEGSPAKLEFEVATIKPATRGPNGGTAVPAIQGGPGTADPTRMTYLNYDLKALLLIAYGLKGYQFAGPEWLQSPEEMFVIQAVVRPGATKDQTNRMLANLLAERFKIALHRETKEEPVYELTLIKRGPMLRESRKEGVGDDGSLQRVTSGVEQMYGILQEKDGFQRLPLGMPAGYPGGPQAFDLGGRGPIQHTVGGDRTIAEGLAVYLSVRSGSPVLDKTGLTGNWDFNLDYAAGAGPASADTPGDPAPDLIGAVRDQLGLKMESKKAPVEVVVVDHAEKKPAEN